MYPIDLLPSPIHLVNDAFWLLRSFQATRRASPEVQPSPNDFDVNIRTDTGFLPASPLPMLQGPYDVWETALANAQGVLKLGETLFGAPEEVLAAGESWRHRIRLVSKTPTHQQYIAHDLARCQSFPRTY